MDELLKSIENGEAERTVEEALLLPAEDLERLIDRAVGLRSGHGGMFLTLLYPNVTDKGLQKLIKKGLFHLKTLGISITEPRTSGESVLRRAEIVREARALLSNYDAGQTRAIIAAVQTKKNQFLFAYAVTHFYKGLEELSTFAASRNEIEGIIG